jgi:hypothetical protein
MTFSQRAMQAKSVGASLDFPRQTVVHRLRTRRIVECQGRDTAFTQSVALIHVTLDT